MLKKLFRIIRFLTIGAAWSYVYLLISNSILILFWNFNILSPQSWHLLNIFWEKGGIIKTGKDYLLLFLLLLLFPIWFWGYRRLLKTNFINLLLLPFQIYNDKMLKKYGADSKRIILKNLGRTTQTEESIDDRVKPKTPVKTDEEVNKIRSAISEKINLAQDGKK